MFYQTKVLEDKPISFFEGAAYGYLSLITEAQRYTTTGNGWSLSGCTSTTSFTLESDRPSTATTQVTNSSTSGSTLTLTSPALGKMKNLKSGVGLTASFHLRVPSKRTTSVQIAMQYYHGGSWQALSSSAIPVPEVVEPTWLFFTHTANLGSFANALENDDYRIVLSITDITGGSASDYVYYINGLAVGQEASPHSATDIGAQNAYSISSIAAGPGTLEVNKYNGLLTAVKSGLPLHRSMNNATLLKPYIPEEPSLTLKNAGFMAEPNKVDVVTLEFWMKVGGVPTTPVRLVGPIGKRTGLYLTGTTLTLSLGNTEIGYDLGSIDYPMLIDWVVSPSWSSVLVNGDAVINLMQPVDITAFSSDGAVGFYTEDKVHPVYVSSIATYQYAVPSQVAKIRFVRGQGTDAYGIISDRYDGTSFSADFSMSEFSNNLSYPDTASWRKGIKNNIVATDMIRLPEYEMPELERQKDGEDWAALNKAIYPRPTYYNDTFPLDVSKNNTSGTGFSNPASNGEVFTTVNTASSSTNLITLPAGWQPGTVITISGEAKFAGTTPQLTVTFTGPGTTYTQNFSATVPKSTATMSYTIPAGTTSITWGVKVANGLVSAQFNNVYARLTYKKAPMYVKPTGYSNEPYLYWHSLNILEKESTAAVMTTVSVASGPGSSVDILKLQKRDTQTYIKASLNGTTLTYEYNDYTGAVVLGTKTIDVGKQFNVGLDIPGLLSKYPEMANLFGQPSDVEVLVGGGETDSFTGAVYHVSFYNPWHKEKLTPTYTDGLADTMIPASLQDVEPATCTLIPVTEYGNFTLDVASTGYWQETLPVSYFTKEVENQVGELRQHLDFIQATIGKTRASLPQSSTAPITYFQLLSRYWAKTYADLASDYATYGALGSVTVPIYDPNDLDLQTWATLHKITDAPLDYTKKTAVDYDGSSTVYLDDNNKRHFVQDGFSLIVPYAYDQEDYAITVYHLLTSRGQRSSPVKLKSFELASWSSSATQWNHIGTQEGNDAYPYTHNGSYYVTDFPSVFEITKRSFNYLYKSNRSGFKPKSIPIAGYDSGVAFGWKRSGTDVDTRSVGGVSFWLMLDAQTLASTTKIMTVTVGADRLFYIEAIPVDGNSKFALQVKTDSGAYTNSQWYLNGNIVGSPYINAGEWNALQLSLILPVDAENQQVYVRASGNNDFVFDHVTIHGKMRAKVSGASEYRRWSDLIVGGLTWGDWDNETWYTLFNIGIKPSVDMLFDEMVTELTGTNTVGQFSSTLSPQFGEIYVLRNLEWVTVPVITK